MYTLNELLLALVHVLSTRTERLKCELSCIMCLLQERKRIIHSIIRVSCIMYNKLFVTLSMITIYTFTVTIIIVYRLGSYQFLILIQK